MFWEGPLVKAGDLHKLNMLHVEYLGMVKHLIDWQTQSIDN